MLRTITPKANDPIFGLQKLAEHIVCDLWCEADENDCLSKLKMEHETIVNAYGWLKDEILSIYERCEGLSPVELLKIKQAFHQNNDIEELCNGKPPVYLDNLPAVVEDKMKPLFVKFYEELLERAKVDGDKLEYYEALYKANRFHNCTCCGFMKFDTGQLERREAYDHYLPKSKYPFASINFKNLVPLCYKCNSDQKKDKDPIEGGRKAFYPFRTQPINLEISTTLSSEFVNSLYDSVVNDIDEIDTVPPKIKDIEITITSVEQEQVETWNDLFRIRARFSETTGQFSFRLLRKMSRHFRSEKDKNSSWNYIQTLDHYIDEFKPDPDLDENYLKIPFLNAAKKCDSLIEVYG
ncbi:hypothetical protein SAMN04489724_0081 [Algoriphagus locisalis]|uniref:HNH endonuclease n=1 Tax=Algoriphagus locisalis TaxID=305507 RepID=A0A1I7E541_9BACT|nr:hypothetical protein [Algoriphagus locisalis]SFU19032.1 hypothetical protein SAMN04489724_0081 [Algoriphagus locisalis]